jgi:hypothetical protein
LQQTGGNNYQAPLLAAIVTGNSAWTARLSPRWVGERCWKG